MRLLGGGFSFGEYDIVILFEAPDDEAAAVALAVAAGGTIKSAQTTRLLSGDLWVVALEKAADAVKAYEPAR